MLVRIVAVAIITTIVLAAIIPILYERVFGVGVIRASDRPKHVQNMPKKRPAAEAYIIGSDRHGRQSYAVVPIYSISDIYASVGVGQKEFSEWQERYGFGTFGKTDEGILFVPNYPVLSKIAWMGIDPIDLSCSETSMLIEECTNARNRTVNAAARTELEELITLARKAIAEGGAVRFGLP